jgi:hypothetical protein
MRALWRIRKTAATALTARAYSRQALGPPLASFVRLIS